MAAKTSKSKRNAKGSHTILLFPNRWLSQHTPKLLHTTKKNTTQGTVENRWLFPKSGRRGESSL
jgi:hypothetical protein